MDILQEYGISYTDFLTLGKKTHFHSLLQYFFFSDYWLYYDFEICPEAMHKAQENAAVFEALKDVFHDRFHKADFYLQREHHPDDDSNLGFYRGIFRR